MKKVSVFLIGLAVTAGAAVLTAQDVVKVDPAHYKVVADNAAVRIIRVTYAAGAKSPMHAHPDSVVVILNRSTMRFTAPDGTNTDSEMAENSAVYSPAASHANVNMTKGPVDAVLVEFKTKQPGKAVIPTSRPGIQSTVLAEGPRAIVFRATADATFVEPAGTKHDYDQVVIALGASSTMSLSIDGKPAKTTWARGDAVWLSRGTAHEASNKGGKPVEFALVSIR